MSNTSPYLKKADRLQDVIAAIQAMGRYKFYKLPFDSWADRISADKNKANHWKEIFEQHPEFFRLDTKREKASLVWRRQHQKLFHVDLDKVISKAEYNLLSENEKSRVTRNPLTSSEIQSLISTAIELHNRAISDSQEKRWWLALISIVAGFVGSVLGGLLSCS